jgi:catechol 2,3-dioxygenase-like lactoylglutathione lyase family enzyme
MNNLLGEKKTVAHICLVVNDIEKTSQDYADFFGIEKPSWFWAGGGNSEGTIYRGEPTDAKAKLAFLKIDTITIELIEPDAGPSVWREFLDKYGESFHHIGFNINGMEKTLSLMGENNMPVLQRGGKEGSGWYSYVDTRDTLKMMVELLEGY